MSNSINVIRRKQRLGDRLSDGVAHTHDHSRRSFLYSLGMVGGAGFLLNRLPVNALAPSALTQALTDSNEDRVLVMIRLKGGNDGLNTIIPVHDFGTYEAARPNVHIRRDETVRLTPGLEVHPQLAPLQAMWNDGQMHMVNNVGYPEQNLSHFSSSDIWATASDADDINLTGVLGTYLQGVYPDFITNPPETPPAIQIGGSGNLLFNNSDSFNYAVSTENPTQLYNIAQSGRLYDVADVGDCVAGEQLGYVRAVANTTFRYAGVLADSYDRGTNSGDYLEDRLGRQLSLIARMLRGGLRTRLFVVEIDGFDTHAEQAEAHAYLLDSVAKNTTAFFADMAAGGLEDRVLAMTYSEFGRRIQQNGSLGTDHGAAAPLFLFGKGLNGNGQSGGLTDLQTTDEAGNMIHQVDFRSVYATVFTNWLCLPPDIVETMLGGTYPLLETTGLVCSGSPTSAVDPVAAGLEMNAYRSGSGLVVDFTLPTNAAASIHLFDIGGRRIGTPWRGRGLAGVNSQTVSLDGRTWAAGVYVVSLEVGGRMYSRKIGLF